jgi:antitoxin CptB
MTGTTRSSDGLSDRRKRLLFRCWHRGTREMDLILGRFADAHIGELSESELDELERLGELPDPDLYAMLSGASEMPHDLAQGLLPRIKAFGAPDRDA